MCKPRVTASSVATASRPANGLPAPNANPPAHVTAATSAPSTAPTTGSAVIAPRPNGRFRSAGTGITVSNAKAVASEPITMQAGGR